METFHGHIRTQLDAILLFEACRLGVIPRIRRRLSERERLQIKSGSIYVWDEREASMRRWTDGKSWSASRVSGSFLTYREMDGTRKGGPEEKPSGRKRKNSTAHAKRSPGGASSPSDDDDRSDSEGCRYKKGGLYKQSFSLTTSSGLKLHMISYYTKEDLPNLRQPSADERLKPINIPLEMYPDTSSSGSNLVPAITTGPLYTAPPYPAPSPQQPHHLPSPPQYHMHPHPHPHPHPHHHAGPPPHPYYPHYHPHHHPPPPPPPEYYMYPPADAYYQRRPYMPLPPPKDVSATTPASAGSGSSSSSGTVQIPSPASLPSRNTSPSDALNLRNLCHAAEVPALGSASSSAAAALSLTRLCNESEAAGAKPTDAVEAGPAKEKREVRELPPLRVGTAKAGWAGTIYLF